MCFEFILKLWFSELGSALINKYGKKNAAGTDKTNKKYL